MFKEGQRIMEFYKKSAMTLFMTVTMGSVAYADMSLSCGDGQGNERLVYVDEGSNDKMTVWNPKTPNIKFEKSADDISKAHFIAYENDAWRIVYDTNKSVGSLTNKAFDDQYGCFATQISR